jgi:capsular polysaccharide biosynthesis protein
VELRQYWQVVVDRVAVVIGTFLVALVVAAASVYMIPQVSAPYQAALILSVQPRPEPKTGNYYSYDGYYSYLTSEYLNDDLIDTVESSAFLQRVRDRLKNFPGGPPSGSIEGKKAHRVLHLTISSPTSDGALALANAVEAILTAPDARTTIFDALSAQQNPMVSVINPPQIVSGPAGRSAILNLAARSLVGLVVGIGLAFLLEYVDDTVKPTDIQDLVSLPVIGEIPGRGLPTPRKKK